ncbi:MAG: response regulator [Kangiellaceae bacterium]|nr:response regulator [Kangiellaceae bacterium]
MTDTILIVEDDYANQLVATLFLKRFGFDTEIAANGAEAIKLAQQKKFPLIYMDCQMPVVDGFAATTSIRNTPGPNQHTPIIALTANLVNGINKQCTDAGMDDVLSKPISMDAFQSITNKWIHKRSTIR